MEKVLKPFDIFFETKFKSLNDNEDESSLLEQARAAWLNLSAKKQTKFILKSQETFDSKEQVFSKNNKVYPNKKKNFLIYYAIFNITLKKEFTILFLSNETRARTLVQSIRNA